MKRAFQNKCGSTLRKILLFIYIDISNKIASHKCFATDTALPSICNNHILVRQSSKVFFFFQEKTITCSFFFFFFPQSLATHPHRCPLPWHGHAAELPVSPVGPWGWPLGEAIPSHMAAPACVPGQSCWAWTLPYWSKIPQPFFMKTQLLSLNPYCDTQCLCDTPRWAHAPNLTTPTVAKYHAGLLRQCHTSGSYWWWVVYKAAWLLSKGLISW